MIDAKLTPTGNFCFLLLNGIGMSSIPAHIHSMGIEEQTSTAYDHNGFKRAIPDNLFVFQYTLSGHGAIRLGEHTFEVKQGQAFFVKLPSDHRYYLPQDSGYWKFLFIVLGGTAAEECWSQVTRRHGELLTLPAESLPIRTFLNLYAQAGSNPIADLYRCSELAYRFLMACSRHFLVLGAEEETWPESIRKTVALMRENYAELGVLDELAAYSGLSKYHFLRLFHRTTGLTTGQYVTQIRMQRAIQLLLDTKQTVEQIAQSIGYANGNYFCKVFRKTIGLSPQQFRSNRFASPSDRVTFLR
ncbi:AraC family transcriptional regulator [Paenibacillus hodogayensis]|uniref:AraC family transcriptional regulator n=1 Tax=Paenibacillus hodogayensis TaxID=279208 RepID=A0ABV5VRV3_9BACL